MEEMSKKNVKIVLMVIVNRSVKRIVRDGKGNEEGRGKEDDKNRRRENRNKQVD
jgi:hypothetical protein